MYFLSALMVSVAFVLVVAEPEKWPKKVAAFLEEIRIHND